VDTRPAPTSPAPANPGLALDGAIINPNNILTTINTISSTFNSIDGRLSNATSGYVGKEIAIKVVQKTGPTTTVPLLYLNSNTSSTLKVGAAGTNTTALSNNLKQLLSIVQERLKSASYPNFATSPVSITVQ
jgi:hypothetical protein